MRIPPEGLLQPLRQHGLNLVDLEAAALRRLRRFGASGRCDAAQARAGALNTANVTASDIVFSINIHNPSSGASRVALLNSRNSRAGRLGGVRDHSMRQAEVVSVRSLLSGSTRFRAAPSHRGFVWGPPDVAQLFVD